MTAKLRLILKMMSPCETVLPPGQTYSSSWGRLPGHASPPAALSSRARRTSMPEVTRKFARPSPVPWESTLQLLSDQLQMVCPTRDGWQSAPVSSAPWASGQTSPTRSNACRLPASRPVTPTMQSPKKGVMSVRVSHLQNAEMLDQKLSTICTSPLVKRRSVHAPLHPSRHPPLHTTLSDTPALRRASSVGYTTTVSVGARKAEELYVHVEGQVLQVFSVDKGGKTETSSGKDEKYVVSGDINYSDSNTCDVLDSNDRKTQVKLNSLSISPLCLKVSPKRLSSITNEDKVGSKIIVGSTPPPLAIDGGDSDLALISLHNIGQKGVGTLPRSDVQRKKGISSDLLAFTTLPPCVEISNLICVLCDGKLEVIENGTHSRRRSKPSFMSPFVIDADAGLIKLVIPITESYRIEDISVKTVDNNLIISGKREHRRPLSCQSSLTKLQDYAQMGEPLFHVFELPEHMDPFSVQAVMTETRQLVITAEPGERIGKLVQEGVF